MNVERERTIQFFYYVMVTFVIFTVLKTENQSMYKKYKKYQALLRNMVCPDLTFLNFQLPRVERIRNQKDNTILLLLSSNEIIYLSSSIENLNPVGSRGIHFSQGPYRQPGGLKDLSPPGQSTLKGPKNDSFNPNLVFSTIPKSYPFNPLKLKNFTIFFLNYPTVELLNLTPGLKKTVS